ncbi:MAG: hypothetical protein NTX25_13680 [Proteobacteria bacterium]|nr:hypothetical protein [Pseudomonadota bacterium]
MAKKIDRRSLIKLGAYGAVGAIGLEQVLGLPLGGSLIDQLVQSQLPVWSGVNPYDAYEMMNFTWRTGLGVPKVFAQGEEGWSLVQIKVCNHVFTPLVFKPGLLGADAQVTTDADVPLGSARMGAARPALIEKGLDLISDIPRLRALRFNKWFADMLMNGTNDGSPSRGTNNLLGLTPDDVGPLSLDRVAIQAFLGLKQITANNHALKGCKLRVNQPDLTLFAQQSGVIASPLGISCFMMGRDYDQAEGAVSTNAVLGKDAEAVVVSSRSVQAYVSQISQFVGKSYADRAPQEQNLIYKMDQLIQKDPKLRRDLVASIAQFQAGMSNLEAAAVLERNRQTINPALGNTQNVNKAAVGASSEFLGQCKYVAAALDLPGMPVRNFSLFLNATDLDGLDADKATDGGGGNGTVQALSNIEAMRQLAMGLNVLAKAIANGKKIMVVVHSEGGRGADMGDAKTSFSLVLGPKAPGMLDDQLYANRALINQSSNAVIKDMAAATAALAWDVEGLKEANGTNATGDMVPSTGDVQLGIIEFLEGQTGVQARKGLSGTDGRFVKLKRA